MLKKLFSSSGKGAVKVANMYRPTTWREHGWLWRILLLIFTFVVINAVLMFIWSAEPDALTVDEIFAEQGVTADKTKVEGIATTTTAIHILDTLLNKSGGYITNDVTTPGILMDNMENWEYGVLRNLREISRVFRYEFSRSQSQSSDDKDLTKVENDLRIDSYNWMLPSAEGAYDGALEAWRKYHQRLINNDANDGYFYARADNLVTYLGDVSKTLGSLSQELSASVGVSNIFSDAVADIANETDVLTDTANTSTDGGENNIKPTVAAASADDKQQTPWIQIDNKFYEARGYSWALLQELRAFEHDFAKVLNDKNAMTSLKQIIRELEMTQSLVWSPFILNGDGFGLVANHSLVMASYISRANAAIIDLNNLLKDG